MASWEQLRQYVHANYKVSQEQGNTLQLGFNLDNGRTQVVYLSHQMPTGAAESWVHIESPFGTLDRVDLGRAVREVGQMVCGGLASVDEFLTLRQTVPLANLDVNEFERPLTLITTAADDLEARLTGRDAF